LYKISGIAQYWRKWQEDHIRSGDEEEGRTADEAP
jgi:hypothetical protein